MTLATNILELLPTVITGAAIVDATDANMATPVTSTLLPRAITFNSFLAQTFTYKGVTVDSLVSNTNTVGVISSSLQKSLVPFKSFFNQTLVLNPTIIASSDTNIAPRGTSEGSTARYFWS